MDSKEDKENENEEGEQLLAHHLLLLQESFWNSRIERWVPSRLIYLYLVLELSQRSNVQEGKGPEKERALLSTVLSSTA